MGKLVLTALLSVMCGMAAVVSETWSGTFIPDSGEDFQPACLVLKQDGDKLTGTGARSEDEQHEIQRSRGTTVCVFLILGNSRSAGIIGKRMMSASAIL